MKIEVVTSYSDVLSSIICVEDDIIAIKQSLRIAGKFHEDELESILENGPYQTRTELKAKRLEYPW
ncbi:hypothetical protein Avbf_12161 [Armadillidium vulgare]|nr:hypothetical protein Avbf_12161 [Armadillidium vulgare]